MAFEREEGERERERERRMKREGDRLLGLGVKKEINKWMENVGKAALVAIDWDGKREKISMKESFPQIRENHLKKEREKKFNHLILKNYFYTLSM